MKVIARDNYCRDTTNDRLEASDLSEIDARALAEALNEKSRNGLWYYEAVPDDYVLHVWEP